MKKNSNYSNLHQIYFVAVSKFFFWDSPSVIGQCVRWSLLLILVYSNYSDGCVGEVTPVFVYVQCDLLGQNRLFKGAGIV